jgi:uncharacterized iron-regulated membrane protein
MVRTILIWLHRYSGLATMLFLAISALTGCILVFRAPIDRALNPDLFLVQASAPSPGQTIAAVDRFARAHPNLQVVGFPLAPGEGRSIPLEVSARPGGPAPAHAEVFVDPRDGSILGARGGEPGLGRRNFVARVAELHFDLLAGTYGRWFLGVVAAAWFVSSLAGLYLTLPQRRPFWKNWLRTWQFRRSSALPRLLLDLHRASGLWLLPFILLLAATSVALNFFGEFYSPAVTTLSPLEHDLFDQDAPFPAGASPSLGFADALQTAERHARQTGLAWAPAKMLYLPEWNLHGVKFSPDGVLDYRSLGPVDYYFDAATGAYRHQVDPYSDSAGLKLIRVIYPLHSGEIFGLGTVALVFVLGLVTFGQTVTGLYVWWKKRASRVAGRRNRRRKAAP